MDKFISVQNSEDKINYLFTKNHYLLLLIGLIVIIFFSMYLSRQKHKVQKISVFVTALLLLILEGLRIFWRYKYLQANSMDLSFLNIVNLNFFTLSLWLSLPLIFISSFKKKKKEPVTGLNFVFSITTIVAIISLIYPQGINPYFEFYHCYNLMFTLIRSLVIMLGIFFAISKWIYVGEFIDHWKGLLWIIAFGGICTLLGKTLGNQTNLFYVDFCPIFESIGMHLGSPWHLIMLGCFMFAFQILLYLPFRAYRAHKTNRGL